MPASIFTGSRLLFGIFSFLCAWLDLVNDVKYVVIVFWNAVIEIIPQIFLLTVSE